MVVALRENGRVLRRSRIVTIAMPSSGSTGGSSTGSGPAVPDGLVTLERVEIIVYRANPST